MNKEVLELLNKVFKYGFSAVLALLGTVLIFLGAIGEAIVPQSFYAGGAIIGFSIIYSINETVLKINRMKYGSIGKKNENTTNQDKQQ